MAGSQGKFVWYELMTSDTKAAEAFYRGVMGWTAQPAPAPNQGYTIFSAGKAGVGGLMESPASARAKNVPPAWIGYVAVDDVDASAAKVTKSGGKLHHGPADIPGVGRFAVIADPHGAILALFKPGEMGNPPTPPPPETPGLVGWRELMAGDREADFNFYAGLFGWAKGEGMDMGQMGIYQILNHGGQMFGGMMTKPPAIPAPFWQYYVNTDNIDAAAQRVRAGGGQILNGPQEVPGGSWVINCKDPQGAAFSLVGPKG